MILETCTLKKIKNEDVVEVSILTDRRRKGRSITPVSMRSDMLSMIFSFLQVHMNNMEVSWLNISRYWIGNCSARYWRKGRSRPHMVVSDITPLSSETKLYEYLDEFETHVVNEIVYCISQMHLEQNQKEKKIEFQEKTHDAVSSFLSPTPLLWMREISSWIYTQWWCSRSVQGTLDGATYFPLECQHLGRFSLVLRIVETRQCCYFIVYVTARLRQLPYYVWNTSLHAIWELSYRVKRCIS